VNYFYYYFLRNDTFQKVSSLSANFQEIELLCNATLVKFLGASGFEKQEKK